MRLVSLLLVIAVASVFAACSRAPSPQRTIPERDGTIGGSSREIESLDVEEGDVVQIVLGQKGRDAYLQLSIAGRELGRFDSVTGRYGEDRVQVEMDRSGKLQVTIGATRLPEVTGSYHLAILKGGLPEPAELNFTAASRIDQPLPPGRRIQLFESAAKQFRSKGRAREGALAAFAASNLLTETSSNAKRAVSNGARAVAELRTSKDNLLLSAALNALAVAYGELARVTEGAEAESANAGMVRAFDEASRLYEAEASSIGLAEVELFKSALAFNAGTLEQPLETFRQIAGKCAALRENACQALATMNASVALRYQGDYGASFDSFYEALKLVNPQDNSATVAQIVDNMAAEMRQLGDFDGAIRHHQAARRDFEQFGECSGVSRSLYGIGYSLLGIGDEEQALGYYELALDRRCTGDDATDGSQPSHAASPTIEALCVRAGKKGEDKDTGIDDRDTASFAAWDLGNFARSKSDPASALACHRVAAGLVATPGRKLGTKLDMVRDLIDLRRNAEAYVLYAKAMSDAADPNPKPSDWYLAKSREVDGILLASRGNFDAAISRFSDAAVDYESVRNVEGIFSAESRRASLALKTRNAQVDTYFADADAALENVRLLSLDPLFSANLFASGRRIYEEWIERVLDRGNDARHASLDALAISERSRGRLLTQVAKAFQTDKDARQTKIRLLAPETFADLENAKAGRAAVQSKTSALPDATTLSRDLGVGASRFDEKELRAAVERLERYRAALDTNTTVIEYLLGEKRGFAWVVRKDGVTRFDLGPAAPIRAAVIEARNALEAGVPEQEFKPALARAYDLVWLPLKSAVAGGKFEIVPDDVLHETPFAALWDRQSGQYLVQQAALTLLPSIQFSASRERKSTAVSGPVAALLVGDPVYEFKDAQVRCSSGASKPQPDELSRKLRSIPESAREVAAIQKIFEDKLLTTQVRTGCAATLDHVIGGPPENYRFIHFATHATADRALPQRSAIHLSGWNEQGQTTASALTAGDLLDYPLGSELIVLSGCSTAGGRQFSGEGSLGLPFSLLAGGSRSVISTLWSIGDRASVTVMRRLYEGLIDRDEPADVALQSAQLEMLKDARWSHPRHWAAYSLLGT